MAGFDTKDMMNRAIRYMAEVATQRAAGGWVPPKERERQQRDAMRQEQQQARQVEKQQKDMMRQEQQQARQAEREQQAQQKQFIADEKERQKNLAAFQKGNHPDVPNIVYHGSPDVRGIFKEGFKPFSRGNVFFASDNYDMADSYADDKRAFDYQNAEPHTIPLHLSMKNPMVIDANGAHWKDTAKHVDDAIAKGHDGLIIKNSVDYYNNDKSRPKSGTVFAWFNPSQAKSAVDGQLKSRVDNKPIQNATGNQGTFDPSNPDITKSEGGQILSKQFPTQYMPNVGRQVMADGGKTTEERQQDATNMNFSPTVLYHAGHSDFPQFELQDWAKTTGEKAHFFITDPAVADSYLGGQYIRADAPDAIKHGAAPMGNNVSRIYAQGAQVYPVRVRDVNEDTFHVYDMFGASYNPSFMKQALNEAKRDKKKGIVLMGVKDPGMFQSGPLGSAMGKSNLVAVFDKYANHIRSVNAQFNPKDKNSRDLLKSEGGEIGRQVMNTGGTPDQPQRQLSPMGFYSAAAERASALQPSGNAVQMINSLRNLHGVKTEELQNAGLIDQSNNVHPDWAGRGKVTRDELISHLQGQMPQVEETVLGVTPKGIPYPEEYEKIEQAIIDKYKPEMEKHHNVYLDRNNEQHVRNAAQQQVENLRDQMWGEIDAALPDREEHLERAKPKAVRTKYEQYTLPGGENYREMLLKLPNQHESFVKDLRSQMSALDKTYDDAMQNYYRTAENNPAGHPDTLAAYDKVREIRDKQYELGRQLDAAYTKETKSNFKSPHWDDPNVLAHIRMSDRIGLNGEKILHVEELQSDWGQKGKKSGFKDIAEREYQSAMREHALASRNVGDTFDKLISSGISDNEAYNHPDFLRAIKNEKDAGKRVGDLNLQMKTGLASAPYVTSTEGWTDLALKRVLKEAAEGGYHKVVWTPGEEQAERYDLKNHVSELLYHPDQQALSYADIDGGWIDHPNPVTPEKLPEVIGKEAAQRLLSQTPNSYDGSHRLKGEDLHFGGEGMKGYYDNIVPKRLQAIAKKHDKNAKVGYTDIMLPAAKRKGSNNPPIQAPGIDITPEMRESILRGQSAYKRGGTVSKKHPVLSIAGTHIREEQHGQPIFTGRL